MKIGMLLLALMGMAIGLVLLGKEIGTPVSPAPVDDGYAYYRVRYSGDRAFAKIKLNGTVARDVRVRVLDTDQYFHGGLTWDDICGHKVPPSIRREFVIPAAQAGNYLDRGWNGDASEYNIQFEIGSKRYSQVVLATKLDDRRLVASRLIFENSTVIDPGSDDDFPPEVFRAKYGWLENIKQSNLVGWLQEHDAQPRTGSELILAGWAADLNEDAPVQKVEILVDGRVIGTAYKLNADRCDVADILRPSWLRSGWEAKVSLQGIEPGVHDLRAVAYNKRGESGQLISTDNAADLMVRD